MSSYECNALGLWGGESEDIIKRDFPIHRACRDGDLKLLQEAWAVASYDHLTAEDKFYGWTPIHWAAYFGKIDCLEALLNYGVSVNLCTSKFKQTPSHIASFGGHPNCILKLLQAGASFHAEDYLGESPIHKASRVGNVECIVVLLNHGSRVDVCNNNGHTPCDLARMQNFLECVNVLESALRKQMHELNYKTHCTPFMNGSAMNGCTHHRPSNKRSYEDESIPNFKRGRFGVVNGCHSNGNTCNGNGNGGHYEDVCMDMDESIQDKENHMKADILDGISPDEFQRAPSPGMDFNILSDDDMQLWGHQNGYGDTPEAIPAMASSSCMKHKQAMRYEAGYDRAVCAHLRGVQARGWH